MKRRSFLTFGAAGIAGSALPGLTLKESKSAKQQEARFQNGKSPWPICLDTATIRPASLEEKVRIASEAGYDAIEPWDGELEEYEAEGGNLKDLGSQIKDLGMFVPSVIGLWNALPPNKAQWDESLVDTRRRMRMASDIGSHHVQTIPNTVGDNYDVKWVANRYKDIIEIGIGEYNIKPALVFVKFFPLKTMGQAAAVAFDSNHAEAMIIPDTYHMHISEGGFEGLKKINGNMIAIFQFADAPASSSIDSLGDADRVYPGDGILPLPSILRDLKSSGYKGCISLELYNPEYWERDLQEVATVGLRKTLEVIEEANV
ncbi:MAG: sugar phosphate isomerase/epimerase [Balneolales bacterium]